MPTTLLCLVRHGETSWNAEGRIQGQLDVPLSARGHAQARAVAQALAHEQFTAIYTSDLCRALHTAEVAARLMRLPLRRHAGLRERHYGALQRLTYAQIRQRHPLVHARLLSREESYVLPGGGESLRQFAGRVHACLDDIVAAHAGGRVLIFTHGGVLDLVHRRASGLPLSAPRQVDIPNAALNWLETDGCTWSVLSWAECSHLGETLDELPG